jgi:hypothetical protein
MHLGYWDVEAREHAWGMIAVLIVIVGLGFVASVVFSDQLQVLFVRFYGLLDDSESYQ